MKLYIESAQSEDFDIAFKLLREAAIWLKEKNIDYWQNWLEPPKEHVAWIKQGFDNGEFYFVENDEGIIAGMFRLQFEDEMFWGKKLDRAGYIHSFTTNRMFKGQGIGYEILRMIEKTLIERGIYLMRRDCSPDIQGLCNFYEKYGFLPQGNVTVHAEKLRLYEKKITL